MLGNGVGVEVVAIDDVPWEDFAEERIRGVVLPGSGMASASVGEIPVGLSQARHRHHRPPTGVELVLVFDGAFRLESCDVVTEVHDTRVRGPVFLEIGSGTVTSIQNCGEVPVRFFSVFAPSFQVGEIEYC